MIYTELKEEIADIKNKMNIALLNDDPERYAELKLELAELEYENNNE